MKFIEVEITEEILQAADKRNKENYDKFGTHNTILTDKKDRIRKSGFVGEELVKHLLPGAAYNNTTDFDFDYKGMKLEVKTGSCNKPPKHWHTVHVMKYQKNRVLDRFIFVKVLNDFSKGWVVGNIPENEFYQKSEFIKKGTVTTNFTVDSDRYLIKLETLYPMEELKRAARTDVGSE